MKRVLVTGGLGFIGSNFIRKIIQRTDSYEALNLDNLSYGANPLNVSDVSVSARYRFARANLADEEPTMEFASKADFIVNFAAETHVDRSISNPRAFIQTNIKGTFNLLEGARRGVVQKFVQISTDEVYGSAPANMSFTESNRLNPSSPYAASKAAAEMLVEAYHKTYGIHTVVLRCTNNFGPYQFPEKFIPKTIINALLGRRISIYGEGKQIRDWIYVADFCDAAEKALERAPAGSIYNVSAGNEVQNIDVAKLVLQRLRKPLNLLQLVEDRPAHDYRYSLESNRIRNELGWKPAHNFTEELGETVEWYVKNEAWWRPLISDKVLSPSPWKENW